jgi:hypothetical protein
VHAARVDADAHVHVHAGHLADQPGPEMRKWFQLIFLKRLPGVGSKPGSSRLHLFSHFHHFTAEPQRLPFNLFFRFGAGLPDFSGYNKPKIYFYTPKYTSWPLNIPKCQ